MWRFLFIALILPLLTGCGNLSPKQSLENSGKIDELRQNQQGVMLDILKSQQKLELQARDIGNLQQGWVNTSNQNSGVQILQGGGGLILIFAITTVGMILVYFYRTRAKKAEKVTELLTQKIALHYDLGLDNEIFAEAMGSDIESEVYHAMVKGQKEMGVFSAKRFDRRRKR